MVTHTPIPYFMDLPMAGVYAWSDTVVEIQREDESTRGDS